MKPENKVKVLELISPEMRQIIDYYAKQPPAEETHHDYLSQRQAYNQDRKYWNADAPDLQRVENVIVTTSSGQILTRIYQATANSSATLFYIHGGGFILGNLDTHDRIMRLLALYTGCTVIGIDYTLSPEARYPQAIKEIADVCQYYHCYQNHHQLAMAQFGFAGDSAGAMLSLASTLWLRDHHIQCGQLCAVLLWYGLYGLQDSASRRLYGGEWDGLRKEDLDNYDNAYLSQPEDKDAPYYCLFNNDLTKNIPPCFIASAQYDPLLDDSSALYQTLQANGITCEYRMYEGTLHAFLHYSRLMKTADCAIREGATFFTQQLHSMTNKIKAI